MGNAGLEPEMVSICGRCLPPHGLVLAAVAMALWLVSSLPAAAQENGAANAAPPVTETPAPAGDPPAPASATPTGVIVTAVLAGGTVNEILLPTEIDDPDELGDLTVTVAFDAPEGWLARLVCGTTAPNPGTFDDFGVAVRTAANGLGQRVALIIDMPQAPCAWPPLQDAHLTISATVGEGDAAKSETFFDQPIRVSVKWFAWAMTIVIVAAIYPLSAVVAWILRRRREEPGGGESGATDPPERPLGFWKSLDPVQITANGYGRGSLAKLQIFLFSLIIFSLLLYHLLRTGVIADISADIMWLLGVSAVGALGGKLVHNAKRRLTLENWTWLRANGWLPRGADVHARAEWRDLFTDYDSKEIDVYSLQMAIFSLVVAVALFSTSLQGLGTFSISENLLLLLGLSQGVFIVGKVAATSSFDELEEKLTQVIKLERKPDRTAAENKTLEKEKQIAAEMFIAVYGRDLPEIPPNLAKLSKLATEETAVRRRRGPGKPPSEATAEGA